MQSSGKQRAPSLRQYALALVVMAGGLAAAVAVLAPNAPAVASGVAIAVAVAFGVFVLGRTLSARPLRKPCPICGADALEKLRPDRELGVHCARCGFRDETGEPDYLRQVRRGG